MVPRDELLRLIREKVPHPATARELAQVLKIPPAERTAFKKTIRDLAASGALLQTRGIATASPRK
jgi:hypothetical protein